VVTGKIQLRNVTAELQGVAEPLEIASGTASLSGQTVSLDPFSASFVQGPDVRGSASFPMHCTDPQSCLVHFDLQSTDISLGRLNELVHPSLFRRPWYHLLTFRRPDALLRLHASGRISATHVSVATLPLSNVSSNLQIYSGHWQMTDLRADILGGHHAGSWAADFNTSPPKFAGNGVVSHLSMAQLAALMRDNWATGTIDGHSTLALAGMDASSLRSSAAGSGTFTWNSGNLRHLNLNGNGSPMVFSRFSGKLTLQNGIFAVSDGKLQSPGGNFDVSGSVSYARQIDMKLVRNGGRSYAISGTLGQPKVVSTPGTPAEASLR
jgi:hypothetical protein